MAGRLFASPAFQIAEHDGYAVSVRQAVKLLVHGRHQPVSLNANGPVDRYLGQSSLERPPTDFLGPGLPRSSAGDSVQPGTQGITDPERATLAYQDQERCLKGVHRLMVIAEDSSTGAENHRPVSIDQDREGELGGLAATGREPLEKLPVRQPGGDPILKERLEVKPGSPANISRHEPVHLALKAVAFSINKVTEGAFLSIFLGCTGFGWASMLLAFGAGPDVRFALPTIRPIIRVYEAINGPGPAAFKSPDDAQRWIT
jgi:hypothetical protein